MKMTVIYFLCALILCQVVEICSHWDWNTGRNDFWNMKRQRQRQFDFGNDNNQNQQQQNNNNNNPVNYDNCFRICKMRVVKEYNPVCASNQATFENRRILGCAQRCGLQISQISHSTCEPSAGGK